MKKSQKYLAPIYGLKNSLKEPIKLDGSTLLRNINLLADEHKLFEKHGLTAGYNVVLEIDYHYDNDDPSEPIPGILIRIINKFEASLNLLEDGVVGVAAVLPVPDTEYGGMILFSGKPSYARSLNIKLDKDFSDYYAKFITAYNKRSVAFDTYRRSRDRYANNDKTIDCCTALESILVPKGERSKKSFILSGLKIMGFDNTEVSKIDDLIEYRNAVIHADMEKQLKLLSGSKYTHSWFEETFELVRKILNKYIEKPWN